jgi:hypothetical protein
MPEKWATYYALKLSTYSLSSPSPLISTSFPSSLNSTRSFLVRNIGPITLSACKRYMARCTEVSAILESYTDLSTLDALLSIENVERAMENCVTYLRALTELWRDMPKGKERTAMHQCMKDKYIRLRAKVNSVAIRAGWFVDISCLINSGIRIDTNGTQDG